MPVYRQKHAHSQQQAYEQSPPKHKKLGQQSTHYESDPSLARAGSGALPSGLSKTGIADKVEQAKQKIKAQGSANMGPSSRLAAAVAGPIKAKKRKVQALLTSHCISPLTCWSASDANVHACITEMCTADSLICCIAYHRSGIANAAWCNEPVSGKTV